MPFFSIIIPTYNRAGMIGKTIMSILAQQEQDWEVIVVDDGSKDHTKAVLDAFKDPRIRYIWQENAERAAARNKGTSLARGQYLNFVDSDDLLYPNHLATARTFIEQHAQPEVIHQAYDIIDESERLISQRNRIQGSMNMHQIRHWVMSPTNVFLRADIARAFPFPEDRRLAATEDSLLWFMLAGRFEILFSDTRTSGLVQHSGRSMQAASGRAFQEKAILFLQALEADGAFSQKYPRELPRIRSRMIGLAALYLALEKKKKAALGGFWRALQAEPAFLFTRRAAAIIKHLLLS